MSVAFWALAGGPAWAFSAGEGAQASGVDYFLRAVWDLGAKLEASNTFEAAALLKNAHARPFRPALDELLAKCDRLDRGAVAQLIEQIQGTIEVNEIVPIDGFLVPADLQRIAVYVFHKRRRP